MNAYIFLQHYWWFVVSLLGALLVFLLFVQGGNSLLFCLGKTEEQKKMMINSTGRKWSSRLQRSSRLEVRSLLRFRCSIVPVSEGPIGCG